MLVWIQSCWCFCLHTTVRCGPLLVFIDHHHHRYLLLFLNPKTTDSPLSSSDPFGLLRPPALFTSSFNLITVEEKCRAPLTLFLCITSFSLLAYLCESVPACVRGPISIPINPFSLGPLIHLSKKKRLWLFSVVLLFSLLLIFPTSCFSKVSVSHFEVPQRSNRERTRAQISSILIYMQWTHIYPHCASPISSKCTEL